MKVRLTEVAEHDLEAIGDAIARNDPAKAAATMRQLRRATQSIGRAPKLSPPVSWSAVPRLRKRTSGRYLIFFQLNEDEVLVLRVAHEQSDWVSLV